MSRVLLLDYGGVLQVMPGPAAVHDLAARLGVEAGGFERRFHAGRREYDRGQAAADYWAGVAGRALSAGELADADAVDLAFWGDVAPAAVRATERAAAAGLRLALLSNMPHAEADAYGTAPWTAPFDRLFFSCRLGLVKPDPAIYRRVLAELDVAPADVTFCDDRADNVDAAAVLGLDARLTVGADALAAVVADLTA